MKKNSDKVRKVIKSTNGKWWYVECVQFHHEMVCIKIGDVEFDTKPEAVAFSKTIHEGEYFPRQEFETLTKEIYTQQRLERRFYRLKLSLIDVQICSLIQMIRWDKLNKEQMEKFLKFKVLNMVYSNNRDELDKVVSQDVFSDDFKGKWIKNENGYNPYESL